MSGAAAAPARAGWGGPFRLAPAVSLDIAGPQLAFSSSGQAGVGFAVEDADAPEDASAFAVWRAANGHVSPPRQVPGAQQVLAMSWRGGTLQLLVGGSPAGNACCSSASVLSLGASGHFGRPHQVVGGLAGATAGQLVQAGRRTVAVVATERGVWAAQTNTTGRWGRARHLAGARVRPAAMQATAIPGARTELAWTGGGGEGGGSRTLYVSTATGRRGAIRGHKALSLASAHGIDELSIAPGPGGASAAWVESWYDRHGHYHSEVVASDLAHPKRTTRFPIAGTTASGLAFAGDRGGDQVLAWKACTWSASCSTRAVVRRAKKAFGRSSRVGSIDAAEAPALTVSSRGEALLGWIVGGHVLARELRPGSTRFTATHVVSSTSYADNLTLSFGPRTAAIAAWSQGTFAPEVVGAVYRG